MLPSPPRVPQPRHPRSRHPHTTPASLKGSSYYFTDATSRSTELSKNQSHRRYRPERLPHAGCHTGRLDRLLLLILNSGKENNNRESAPVNILPRIFRIFRNSDPPNGERHWS